MHNAKYLLCVQQKKETHTGLQQSKWVEHPFKHLGQTCMILLYLLIFFSSIVFSTTFWVASQCC